MINYIDKNLKQEIEKQKKKCLKIYFFVLAVYVISCVGLIIWYSFLPYGSNMFALIKGLEITLSAIFVAFSFLYLAIKYKRVKCFYKMLNDVDNGLLESTTAQFIRVDERLEVHQGVDMKSLVFLEYNKYKKGLFERKVLVYYELPFPKLEENEFYEFNTQGNVLVSYQKAENVGENK